MKNVLPLSKHLTNVSEIAYGCMGLGGGWNDNPVSQDDVYQTQSIIETAMASGITLFDHATSTHFLKQNRHLAKY